LLVVSLCSVLALRPWATLSAGSSERLPELAYHFARCAHDGRVAKAVEYALRAGRESLDQLAHERGAAHFATALELLHRDQVPDGERLRCDATIGLGECRRRAGDSSYRATLLDAARQAERLGDTDRLALAALTNGRDFFSTAGAVDEERVATLRSALAAGDGADDVQRALLLAQLAMELTYAGDWHGRLALSDEALAIARRHGDPATLVRVLNQRSVALWGVHGLELRRAAVIEAEQQLAQLSDPSLTFHISHQGAHAALAAGDVAGAERRLQTMHDHAASAGQPTLTWFERVAQHRRAILAGRVRDAQRLAFEALDAGPAAGQTDAVLWWAGQMFGLRLVQGRLGETDYGRFPAFMQQCPTLHLLLSAQLGAMQAAHGDVAAAQATLADLMANDLRDVPLDFSWIAVALAGHICWQLGDRARAQIVADVLFAVGGVLRRHGADVAGLGELLPRAAGGDARAAGRGSGALRGGHGDARALWRARVPGAHVARMGRARRRWRARRRRRSGPGAARRRCAARRPRARPRRRRAFRAATAVAARRHAGLSAGATTGERRRSPRVAVARRRARYPGCMISPRIDRLLENVDSNYASVLVAAKRARQINSYYHNLGEGTFDEFPPPMVDTGSKNYLTIALEEVAAGKIKYQYR
jgi:DNA-directed RNA polymerase omega subunit